MKTEVYFEPYEIWDYFRKNGKNMSNRVITLAETSMSSIQMTADDDELILYCDTPEDLFAESCNTQEEAEEKYAFMLQIMLEDDDPPEEPDEDPDEPTADDLDPIMAATYAYTGVLLGQSPEDAGLTDDDLEEIIVQLGWFLKGRHGLDIVCA